MTTSYNEIRTKDFGAKPGWINDGIVTGVPITIRAWNWIPVPSCGTFLYSEGSWFGTNNSVVPTTAPLDDKYQFIIAKCDITNPAINYGDMVALLSVGSRKYMQCGAGTCSGVDDRGCTPTSWQSFTIESTEGKTGPVNYGDPVRIRQVVGNKCAVTAAGDTKTWCADNNHVNSYMIILPANGSVYIDPTAETKYYTDKLRDKDFQILDPLAAGGQGLLNKIGDWFGGISDGIRNTLIVMVLILFAIVIAIVVMFKSRTRHGGEEILTDVTPAVFMPTHTSI